MSTDDRTLPTSAPPRCSGASTRSSSSVSRGVAQARRLGADETLFLQGDAADAFYLLAEGRLKVFKLLRDGRTATVRHVEPGQTFAEAALFQETYPSSTETLTDCLPLPLRQGRDAAVAARRAAAGREPAGARWRTCSACSTAAWRNCCCPCPRASPGTCWRAPTSSSSRSRRRRRRGRTCRASSSCPSASASSRRASAPCPRRSAAPSTASSARRSSA